MNRIDQRDVVHVQDDSFDPAVLMHAGIDAAAEDRAFDLGLRSGWSRGYAVGYAEGVSHYEARVQAWLGVYRAVVAHPAAAELEERRRLVNDGCRSSCGRCSACIRAGAVKVNRERYGQDDFPGVAA